MQATEVLKRAGYEVGTTFSMTEPQDVPPVEPPFKVGDVVRLKSGGPEMTITDINLMPGNITVYWFAGPELAHDNFPAVCLAPAIPSATNGE